jgi:DNA-binding NtrC family response regulator
VERVETAAEAHTRLALREYDAMVVAAPVPGGDVEPLIERMPRRVVLSDPHATARDAARYVRLGALDVAGRDDDPAALAAVVLETIGPRRDPPAKSGWRELLVGQSRAIERTLELIERVAERRATVLITGETGTGKDLMARALHLASPRAKFPMVTVNAAALPENLLEAELFGHVRGAFTGAVQQRVGRFEQAHRSTLFLDEIGDLPLDLQTKLLRFLQEREFQRVGSSETLRVDVRLIAATNVDLAERVRQGRFREDLYYRLNVIALTAPPLRERPEDIPILARHFVDKVCRLEQIPERRLSPEAIARLKGYPWPGNVRQLENAVETAVALSGARELLEPADFGLPGAPRPVPPAAEIGVPVPNSGLDFERTIGRIERQILEDALRKTKGNKTAAADMLGLKRTTLSAKLRTLAAAG